MTAKPSSLTTPLCQLPPLGVGRISRLLGGPEFCQRAREMGFCESAIVSKVSGYGALLCQINGNRIALSHEAASQILVERLFAR